MRPNCPYELHQCDFSYRTKASEGQTYIELESQLIGDPIVMPNGVAVFDGSALLLIVLILIIIAIIAYRLGYFPWQLVVDKNGLFDRSTLHGDK